MRNSEAETSSDRGGERGVMQRDLFAAFFRIGLLTLGGGLAMTAVMHYELVLKRRWLSEEEFAGELSVAAAVPGPIAVNMAFLQGKRLRGKRGAMSAVIGTVIPSFVVILLVVRFALPYLDHPKVAAFFKGCALAIAGQIAFAAFTFGKTLIRDLRAIMITTVALLVVAVGFHPIWAILVAATFGYAVLSARRREGGKE